MYGPITEDRARTLFLQAIPVLLFVKVSVFLVMGVYRGLWRYVSLDNIIIYIKAVITGSVFLSVGSLVFAFRFAGYSRVVFVLDALILLFLVTGSRMVFRMLRQLLPTPTTGRSRRVLILWALVTAEESFSCASCSTTPPSTASLSDSPTMIP